MITKKCSIAKSVFLGHPNVYLRSLFNTLHVSKKPDIGQIARDVSSSSSILIEPSFLLVQFNHTPSVISAVWKSLRLSPCCLERKRENKIDHEKKTNKKWTQWRRQSCYVIRPEVVQYCCLMFVNRCGNFQQKQT